MVTTARYRIKRFDPNQPRDPNTGQWTDQGGLFDLPAPEPAPPPESAVARDRNGRHVVAGARVTRPGMLPMRVHAVNDDGTITAGVGYNPRHASRFDPEKVEVQPDLPSDPDTAAAVNRILDEPRDANPAGPAPEGVDPAVWVAAGDWVRAAAAHADDPTNRALADWWRDLPASQDVWAELAALDFPDADSRAAAVLAAHAELRRRDTGSGGMRYGLSKGDHPEVSAPDEVMAAVNRYQMQGPKVNRLLRGQPVDDPDGQVDADVRLLDQAMTPTTESLLTQRGTDADALTLLAGDPHNAVGKVITDPGFLSTGTAQSFDRKDVQWMIRVPAGTPAAQLPMAINAENELLLGRGQHAVIHAVYRGPNEIAKDPADLRDFGVDLSEMWFVEAEIVPADWTPPAGWAPDPLGDAPQRLFSGGGWVRRPKRET